MNARDQAKIESSDATRRYFDKFDHIITHLGRVAALMQAQDGLSKQEIDVIWRYVTGLSYSFRALSQKYLFAGRSRRAGQLSFDRRESGFPLALELMEMANDAAQAEAHLAQIAPAETLKDQMVETILEDLEPPVHLQFAMSQRVYYEELMRGGLFWPKNDPVAIWQSSEDGRRRFLVHWAVYDTQVNLPQIYLLEVEDSGRTALPKDQRRWPEVQAHLMAQSVGGLKLLTIARGFDEDFEDLHPKRLRRFHIGPMYSSAFTQQVGPLRSVLENAASPVGQDWALVWTLEELVSSGVDEVKTGWFSSVERQSFALDMFGDHGVTDIGASKLQRSIILPERPYQVLEDLAPPGFARVQKFVVAPGGHVARYR